MLDVEGGRRVSQATTTRISGAASELVTPFSDQGEVMLDRVADEISFLAGHGVTGVMVNGFASEALMMSEREKESVARAAKGSAPAGLPIIGTVIAGSTKEAIGWVRRYQALDFDLVAVATPTLYPFGSRLMGDYVKAVARASELPVIVYNSPEAGNKLAPETVADIAEACDNVIGYKDSTQNLIELQTLITLIGDDRLAIMSGSDALTVPIMFLGGVGVISLVTAVFPELIVDMCSAATAGNWTEAKRLQLKTLRVRSALKIGPFMAAYKYAARLIGADLGQSRSPLRELTAEEASQVKAALQAEGLVPA
jgi:4-hydroxy-tetrahydrodipicolinate synthase